MKKICDYNKCTSCKACSNICTKNAIKYEKDDLGKEIPVISDNCINCGLCVRTCPVNKPVTLNENKKCYAAWTLDKEDQICSSSGGIAAALAKQTIFSGGKVFGTIFEKDDELLKLKIVSADNLEKIKEFRGSKYVQSDTGNSFRKVREFLLEGQKVLYIGMPCQIAGLNSYLSNLKIDCSKLVTIDIICHGMPPITYLHEYIEKKVNRMINNITFRGKHDFQLCFYEERDKKPFYRKNSNCDMYFSAFLKGLIHRDSCYSCIYARKERTGDITIGDFWGLDKSTLNQKYDGKISVILQNTDKGKELLQQCSKELHLEERTLQEAVEGNAQLRKPSIKHVEREKFEELYKEKGFYNAIKSTRIANEVKKNRAIDKIKTPFRPIKKLVEKMRKKK